MSTSIYRPESHEEWLKLRANGIGSSEIAAVCGLSKYTSPRQWYIRKMAERNGEYPEFHSDAADVGHWMEGGVALGFEARTGHRVIRASEGDWIVASDRRPYMQASPDRTYWIDENAPHNEQNKGILECKTTNLRLDEENDDLITLTNVRDGETVEVTIPITWYCQVQWLLACSEKEHGCLAYIRKMSSEFNYVYIDKDEDFVDKMLKEADDMWNNHILKGVEPECTTEEDITEVYPDSKEGSVVQADDEILNIYGDIKDIDDTIAPLKKQRDLLTERLKVFAKDIETVTDYEGKAIYTYKQAKERMVLNEKRLQLEHPDIYDRYLESKKGSRTLRLK